MSGPEEEGTPEFRRLRSAPTPPEGARPGKGGRGTSPLPSAAVRRKRVALLLAGAMSVLVLCASGTAWALSGWVSGQIDRSDVFSGMDGRPPAGPTGALNFLVLGSDKRSGMDSGAQSDLGVGRAEGQRADTMMLVHLNNDRDKVSVVGLPRDSWVDIPGHGKGKMNSAYAYGGPKLAIETVESATHVRVDHYAEVDFTGFVDVVDALDGIEVCLPEAIEDPKAKLSMEAGTHQVDGAEALAYSRTRTTSGGDLDRIERQQQVMAALLEKAVSSDTLGNPGKFASFLDTALGSVTVDKGLDTGTINELGNQLRSVRLDDVSFAQVPLASTDFRTPQGASAVKWDDRAAADLFAKVAADKPLKGAKEDTDGGGAGDNGGDEKPSTTARPDDVELQIYNGIGSPGLGSQVRSSFTQAGFRAPAAARNWETKDVEDTLIRYAPKNKREAELVADSVPDSELEEDDSLGDQVQVVVGFSYSKVDAPPTAPKADSGGGQQAEDSGGGKGGPSTAKEVVCD